MDKGSHAITSREIADKLTMTVRVDSGTEEVPVPEAQRKVPSLEDKHVIELAQLGADIEALYGLPVDIEWAIVDGVFSVLQARPVTALPEPEAEPPTEWTMPDPKAIYFRSSIVELLPNPLTPLFATLGRSLIHIGFPPAGE